MSPTDVTSRSMPRFAVVTGASRGLGAVLARFLAGEEFELVLTARHRAELESVREALAAFQVPVHLVVGDVADDAHRAAIAAEVARRGRLDLMVNNASELGPSPLLPLADLPIASLERILRVNLIAPLALTAALRKPLAAAGGLVVNISSDAAVGAYPGWGGYGSSKAALDLASRTLAAELAPEGIHVLAVDPGDMRTAMHQAAYPGQDISDRPEPEATLPFWTWLLGQAPATVSGTRLRAQAERWGVPV